MSASALETALTTAIRDSAALKSSFGDPVRLVEQTGARVSFPYLRLARHDTRAPGPEDGVSEHRIDVEIISRAGGRAEALNLLSTVSDEIRAADITPAGVTLILLHPVYSDVFLRRDQVSWRGLLRLRALTENSQ